MSQVLAITLIKAAPPRKRPRRLAAVRQLAYDNVPGKASSEWIAANADA